MEEVSQLKWKYNGEKFLCRGKLPNALRTYHHWATVGTIVRCFFFYYPPRPGNIHWYLGVGGGGWGLIIFRGSSIISIIYVELNTGRWREGWGNIHPVYRFLSATERKTKFVNLSSLVSIVEKSLNGWLLNLDFKSSDCIRPGLNQQMKED